jgi:hypothetical protein
MLRFCLKVLHHLRLVLNQHLGAHRFETVDRVETALKLLLKVKGSDFCVQGMRRSVA